MDRRTFWLSIIALAALATSAAAADEFSTLWASSAKSEARLVAADARLAGFEIRLALGAITYWRNPGEAGVPPTFDFTGSDNIASVEPVFPAPERIAESDGSEAFGYEHGVVFPLRINRRDAAKPATLEVNAHYAVCEKICLPAQAQLSLTLPSQTTPYAGVVDAALAAAPRAVPSKDFGDLTPEGADGWRLCAPHQEGKPRDLFVEAPERWWVSAKSARGDPGRDCFTLSLIEKPSDADFPVALRLTMTGGKRPVETRIEAPQSK